MFKISDFSRFTRVSVKMLRHYDELGLLKPVSIDSQSGYRYYSSDQLPRLNRIIALKDLGFRLEQIGKLLDENLSPDEIRGMFRMRQAEIEQNLQLEQARLAQVEARLRFLEQEVGQPKYDVVLRDIAPQLVASIRQKVSDADREIEQMFDELEAYVSQFQARAANSPLTIYFDDEYFEKSADVEVAVPITQPIPANGRIAVRELPGIQTAACVVFTGEYKRADEALNTLMIWIETNGYRSTGLLREVYLRFGTDMPESLDLPSAFLTDKRELYVTEIQLPVEKAKKQAHGDPL
jgi:DNA-binding transcriptional MerR regulator